MATYHLHPPAPLEIHDAQASEKWKKFKAAWNSYALALELDKKPQVVQVATLLTVIGEDAREVYSTFTDWDTDGDESKLEPVLTKFEQYCRPRKNVLFQRYCFNCRQQEAGELMSNTAWRYGEWPKSVSLAQLHLMKSCKTG